MKLPALFPFLLLLVALLCGCQRATPMHPALKSLPPQMLWAWERTEDLRWLPSEVGVAYVASTIELSADTYRIRPRQQALYVPANTVLVPMVHVDPSFKTPPALNAAQQHIIVEHILRAASASKSKVVQLDFEVKQSQRAFLRAVVQEARRRLPADVALSMTALASWCAGDYWLQQMAADEIVPMAFRMGAASQMIRSRLRNQGQFAAANCRQALGFASDEVIVAGIVARTYYFSPRSWNADSWQDVTKRSRRASD